MVSSLNKSEDIDDSYYKNLADAAIETISQYGDYNWFVSDEPYDGSLLQLENTLPFYPPYVTKGA